MPRSMNKSFKVHRIDDDSPLTEDEWPTTCEHNRNIFRELRPNTKMIKKIYQILYYEKNKLPKDDRDSIVNVYDIKITPPLLRRITEQSLKGRYNHNRHRYKTYTMEEYQDKLNREAKLLKNYKGLNILRGKIEITFD